MKVLVVGATGAIGSTILQHVLQRKQITQVIALTRKPLSEDVTSNDRKLETIIIDDSGNLDQVPEETWEKLQDADALIWAMGTYTLDENVNLKYPLAFQGHLAKKISSSSKHYGRPKGKLKFILLGGAFVEPDQSRWLYFLGDQRRMKGALQTKTIEFAETHREFWEAIVIRPGGVLFGGNTMQNTAIEYLFGTWLAIKAEELGACVVDLVVNGSPKPVVSNAEMVERGRKALAT